MFVVGIPSIEIKQLLVELLRKHKLRFEDWEDSSSNYFIVYKDNSKGFAPRLYGHHNDFPHISLDEALEKLFPKALLLEDLKPGQIAKIISVEKGDEEYIGEIVYCVYNHMSDENQVYTLVYNGKSDQDPTEFQGPWYGKLKVELINSITIER